MACHKRFLFEFYALLATRRVLLNQGHGVMFLLALR